MKNDVELQMSMYSHMHQIRSPWMPLWQEISDIFLPNRSNFTTKKSRGQEISNDTFDASPRIAHRNLSSTVDSLLKPKGQAWLRPAVEDEDIMDDETASLWLEGVGSTMWRAVYNPKAQFIQRSGETDYDLVGLGTGTLWTEENRTRTGLRFKSFHLSQVVVGENAWGEIDRFAYSQELEAHQAVLLFPDTVHDKIRKDASDPKKKHNTYEFVQIVIPNPDYDPERLDVDGMQFISSVIDMTHKVFVEQGGFHEFPVAIPRWETMPGEIYGRSPAMFALPDARTLQAMGKTILIAGNRAVDPPIYVEADAILSPVRTYPGGMTHVSRDISSSGQPIGVLDSAFNLPIGRDMQKDYRDQVESAFFKDVFDLGVIDREMTATEILERKEAFIRQLGPVFGRLEADYIGPVVERVFGIMERAGAFPERPEVLKGRTIQFQFQSPVQLARKQIEVAGLSRSLELLGPVGAFQPDIYDNFDGDEITRDAPEYSGIPSKWLRTIKDRDELRQQRAESQAEQGTLESAPQVADALETISRIE